jgi:glutamate---methylamine ligase
VPEADARRLPTNLLDALRALKSSDTLGRALGAPFVAAYTKLKEHEWHEHQAHISAFERVATLDC